jgi:PAS domain S-box-containing protein
MNDRQDLTDVIDGLRREVSHLRGRLRDVVAFSSMRPLWTSGPPEAIAQGLAGALSSTSSLDLVFVRLRFPPHAHDVRILRAAAAALPPDETKRIADVFDRLVDTIPADRPFTAPDLLGDGDWLVTAAALGPAGEYGTVVAASRAGPFPDDSQQALMMVAANQVTAALKERQLFESERDAFARRESEDRLRATFAHAAIGIAITRLDGRFLEVNRAFCDITGYAEAELLAIDAASITHPEDVAAHLRLVQQMLAGSSPGCGIERRYVRRDGASVWAQESASLIRDTQGVPRSVVFLVLDVTNRKRAEARITEQTAMLHAQLAELAQQTTEKTRLLEEVSVARDQLDALSRRLVNLQEEERRAIARELHDEIGQLLTAIGLMVEDRSPAVLSNRQAELTQVVRELIARVRNLSMSLRPPMLDALGLLPTLLWQIDRVETQTGMRVEFHHANLDRRFPPPIEIAAFRIVQEALTNVARHAGVTAAKVEVWASTESLGVRIQDQGRGFDPEMGLAGPSSGLAGMRERARLLGGSFTIQSSPGHGACFLMRLPLSADGGER